MATRIINNPSSDSGAGMNGLLLGLLLLIVILGIVFFVYGFPLTRENDDAKTITIPEQVNIDVTTPSSGESY